MAKAWDVPGLGPTTPFREAAGRVILVRWVEMMSYRDGTLRGEDVEELHAMRVASRRLRAAMDAFAEAFPRKSFKAYLREIKAITDTLGDARDLDVAVERLRALLPELAPDERPGVEGLATRYADDRARETPRIAELFARIEDERFGERFQAYVERHTGVAAADVVPAETVEAAG